MEGEEWAKNISMMKQPAAAANSMNTKKSAAARAVQIMRCMRMNVAATVRMSTISMKKRMVVPAAVVMNMGMMNRQERI